MRKKFQDKMFEVSYIFELIISIIVGVAIAVFAVHMVIDLIDVTTKVKGFDALVGILDKAIALAIGAELIKMLCKHTPETIIEVLAFALARRLIVGHAEYWENFITVIAIAFLFGIRRFLLKSHDMVETPDGLVENKTAEEAHSNEKETVRF